MRSVVLSLNVFDGEHPLIELELRSYEQNRKEPWQEVDVYQWSPGDGVSTDEAVQHWEMLAGALIASTGAQQVLPF